MKIVNLVFLISLVVSCMEEQPVYDLPSQITTPEGEVIKLPDPKENNRTLLGVDANENGVRDDVEIYIYHTHKGNDEEIKYLLLLSKVLNQYFKTSVNQEDARAIKRKEFYISDCVGYAVGVRRSINIEKAVRKITFNTHSRVKYRKRINEAVGTIKIVSLERSDCSEFIRGI